MKNNGNIHLVIATPAYGRQVTALYASSILRFMEVCHHYGIPQVEVAVQSGDALISRARRPRDPLYRNAPGHPFTFH